ncbi:MAG: C4-dicarboxylate ABC transporter [candidate division KSB1 bacterium]|nr:C4-dicarboxylate ABC transporter [candidate division KSB1 bacterium]MDZ7336400.1 C4-dicarboxylate ABC transporter [candidate division KSB1 bacterium]MDZ7358493.1 C4-dicarboxylate ABC transporter [candidate division KSB1 bacterium]MDZ7401473.1 C4-dicarboxylate ABC transporter [candidate division KSB1 bacterium]
MTLQIGTILLIMVVAYALASWRKFSVEICMLAAAIAGGIAGAVVHTPPIGQFARHLVEGTLTYLDVMLLFVTATIFIKIIAESGGVNYVVRGIVKTFYGWRLAALLLLMIVILIPGALTGAGSVSILTVGAPCALALRYLGVSLRRVAAILFIIAGLSAAAPPVNIWAMILTAGTAIPYVGFELPLGIPVLILGTFTILVLGWKREHHMPLEEVLNNMPQVPEQMRWWRVLLPFATFFGLVIAYRIWPFTMPILGLPLQFTIAAIVALMASPKRINILTLSRDTVQLLLPLLAAMAIVGSLQQIMTVTGVRGLISYAVLSTPLVLLYILLIIIIPISEGVLTYGAAAIIGIPLVWFLDSIGLHATVVIAGLSLLWPLGDGLPPTAFIGRLSVMMSEYKDSYWSFLRATWLPWIVITIVAILMIIFSDKLGFLVEWSM